jgi:uroporphyrin-III C-methyltransferase / precorrin-2 dehydrogenase / sirohydrochlorin ferrochelatase
MLAGTPTLAGDGGDGVKLFPLFLKLEQRQCLVVGAGTVALEKVEGLLRCGAWVRVVSPEAIPAVKLLSDRGKIEWLARRFAPEDLAGSHLVIAATSDRAVNRAVFEEASRRSILCNAVDDPPLCDFFYASVVERGDLQVAISTAGKSPALAQRLRREIDRELLPDLGRWLEDLGDLRREALERLPAGELRKGLLHELAHRDVCSAEACPARQDLRAIAAKMKHEQNGGKLEEAPEVTTSKTGRVYLVGAGPGDPELLTQKAVRVLSQADIVLHDDLVPAAILQLAGQQALVVSVGKRCGSKNITQAAIHEWMISSALRGLSVVRLKSGDPMIFGRAGEEMDALREAQVPFEAIPGVTAASSAAALLEVSLTDRRFASKLIVLSGHHAVGERPEQWIDNVELPEDATAVIYMPGRNLAETASLLLVSGVSPTMPCVVVSDASRPEASYQAARLGDLASVATNAAPRMLLVGRTFEAVLARGENPQNCLSAAASFSPPIQIL